MYVLRNLLDLEIRGHFYIFLNALKNELKNIQLYGHKNAP